MNNNELESRLKAASVPDRPQEYWDEFPNTVLARLRHLPKERPAQRTWRPRLAWSLGLAFACLAIGFAIGQWHGKTADPFAGLKNGVVLHEVLAMFPNRVRAVLQDEEGVHLVLSDKADIPTSPPLWLKIAEGGKSRALVTFSGQEIEIAGEKVEVLADTQGQVMLMGKRLFWSSKETRLATGPLQIQAEALPCTL